MDQKFNGFADHTVEYDRLELLIGSKRSNSANEYSKGLYNIFESVVESERSAVTEIKKVMLNHGACGAMMSGSGTSVFGIFENETDAKNAASVLNDIGAISFVCYPQKP